MQSSYHSHHRLNLRISKETDVQKHTTRFWAFSVGIGPLFPLLSQFFYTCLHGTESVDVCGSFRAIHFSLGYEIKSKGCIDSGTQHSSSTSSAKLYGRVKQNSLLQLTKYEITLHLFHLATY
jgi:hypothetical protein